MSDIPPGPLRAVPRSLVSWDYRILVGEREIAVVDRAWVRERGRFTLDGEEYAIEREGLVGGRWHLRSDGRTVAWAEKPSAFRRTFEVTVGDRRFTLRPAGILTRGFVLKRGPREVGSVGPERPLSRRIAVELPEDLPLAVRIFVVFLVVTIWKRMAAASGSG